MLTKIKTILTLLFKIGPALVTDVEGTITKIEADKTLSAKFHDFLDLGIEVLTEVVSVL